MTAVTTYTEPHWDRCALLTIDMQRDFVESAGAACIPGTAEIVPALAGLTDSFRRAGRPIVHIMRLYLPDGSNVDACRRARIEAGTKMACPSTPGAQVVPELLPASDVVFDWDSLLAGCPQSLGPSEWALYKPRWGAFYRTPLESHLRATGVDTVVVAGCNFPNCPRTTLYEASERDFRIVFVPDATSQTYERGTREIEGIGATILSADDRVTVVQGADAGSRSG